MKRTITYTCGICGNKSSGMGAKKKIKFCESLGEPEFLFKVGETVGYRSFICIVKSRHYVRRGQLHGKNYEVTIPGLNTKRVIPENQLFKSGFVAVTG